jgi:TRAP-type C4-dicarboxylate transport system substrate-binding protein
VSAALQRGIVDGLVTGLPSYYASKFWESVKVANLGTDTFFTTFLILVNIDAWNELPKDVQDIVLVRTKEYDAKAWKATLDEEKEALGVLETQHGVTLYETPKSVVQEIRALSMPIWDKYISDTGPEAAEIIKKINDFVAAR